MKKDLMVCLGLFMTGGGLIGGLIVHDKMEKQCKILLDSIELYLEHIRKHIKDILENNICTEDEKVLLVKKVNKKINESQTLIMNGACKNLMIIYFLIFN